MDWLANVLVSTNAIPVLITGTFILILVSLMGRYGLLQIHTDKFSLGVSDTERNIIRQQIEYAEIVCMSFLSSKNLPADCNKYRVYFVNEKIFDEMIKWISFNHITTAPTYIETRQNRIWGIISTYTEKSFFATEDFRKACDIEVAKIIEKFVEIREYYKKKR